jgi:hypothetical protein
MKHLSTAFLFTLILTFPLLSVFAGGDYSKAKKNVTDKRIPYYENQMKDYNKGDVKISVDFESYPKTAKAMKNLDFDVLARIRGAVNVVTNGGKKPLKGKLAKFHVSYDKDLDKAAYEYDSKSKTVKVKTTPKEKYWIDADALVSYLEDL